MKYTVVWTDFAQRELRKIHDFYLINTNQTLAQKIAQRLVKDSLKLESDPQRFQTEVAFTKNGLPFRYLVSKHYKIIYWINQDLAEVVIVHVFDTRRNPDLMNSFT